MGKVLRRAPTEISAYLYVLARLLICMPLALGSTGIDQMGLFFYSHQDKVSRNTTRFFTS